MILDIFSRHKNQKIPSPEELASKKWVVQGFNSSLNYIMHGPLSSIVNCWKELGYGYTEQLFVFDKEYLEYHYLEDDFRNVGKNFLDRYEKDNAYFDKVMEGYNRFVKAEMELLNMIKDTDFRELSNKDLFEIFHEIADSYNNSLGYGHVIEGFSFMAEPMLKDKLSSFLGVDIEDKKFREIFNILIQPNKPSWVGEEELELFRLARLVKQRFPYVKNVLELPDDMVALLEAHRKRFFYFQLNYYHADGLNIDYYFDEIRNLIDDGIDLDQRIKYEEEIYAINGKKRSELITQLSLPDDISRLVELVVSVLHWQDDRKRDMLSAIYYLDKALKEISNRYKIPLEVLKMCSWSEINEKELSHFDVDFAKRRLDGFAVYFWNDKGRLGEKFYVGDDFTEFKKDFQKIENLHEHIHGMCASIGKVMGKVKICKTLADLSTFQEGDILVAMMTRPEFVPAMKKAAAIVTDEGGITSHAAIVARELGKPCVIGTRVASKVLKDGDIVEVNANHGIIKRIS